MIKTLIAALLVFCWAGVVLAEDGEKTNAGTAQAELDRLYKSDPVDTGY